MGFYFKTIRRCRSCSSRHLLSVLSLGKQYVSDFLNSKQVSQVKVPLELVLCDKKRGGCGLLQLKHNTSLELMYRHYWYHSGMNKTMRAALADITEKVEQILPLRRRDIVLDIGCNDGTLLESYRVSGLVRAGFEPSTNLVRLTRKKAHKVFNDFFNYEAFHKAFPRKKAMAITSIAMFYDLEDPNRFVADVARSLAPEGLWIIQMSYLLSMLKQNSFDNICHEHLEYYSMASLAPLLQRHGLKVVDVERNDVNGGSFRIYIQHAGMKNVKIAGAAKRLAAMQREEFHAKLEDPKTYAQFAQRILAIKEKLCSFMKKETARGKKIYVYGPSTKGNTLLQFLGLRVDVIPKAADKNREKWGKKTVGSEIPIISEAAARKERPDYFLILPWHFLKEFQSREKKYLKKGGKFIVPLPRFKIIGANNR